jgi:hypothetical protein
MRLLRIYAIGVSCFLFLFASCQQASQVTPLTLGLKCVLPRILRESSGLCYTDGELWTFGDGGNPHEIFKIDSSTGKILQTVEIENFPNIDWEDITADASYIYIGDFGNNNGNRTDLKIIRIKKEDLKVRATFLKVQGEAILFSYADQTNFAKVTVTDYDCESLISMGHFLYLFTKDHIDLKTRCYKVPNLPGTYKVSPVSSFDSKGKITAAAFNPGTKEIALLGYMNKKEGSFIWFLDGYRDDDLFGGRNTRITIGSPKDWQTEGLDYISASRLFLSCETSKSNAASLYFLQKN